MMRISIIAAGFVLAIAMPAMGQTNMEACAVMLDDVQRLACYDDAMAHVSAEAREAAAKRRVLAAEAAKRKAEEEAQAKREAFGAEGLGSAGSRDGEKLDRLDAKVAEVFTDSYGHTVFALDNNQMWRQTEGLALPPVHPGDAVLIKRGMMAGYRLTLPKQGRTVQVKRMR